MAKREADAFGMLLAPVAEAANETAFDPALSLPAPQPVQSTYQKPAQCSGLPPWRLKRVLEFIEHNLAGDISLQSLAAVACLSAHHFSELFRISTGVSPYRFVLARRVEHAKALLRGSMLGVLDVALAVGFADQSHFSKVFRRATGVAPSVYRTIMWAEGIEPLEARSAAIAAR